MSAGTLKALIRSMRHEADGIVSIELCPVGTGQVFPSFQPGSHIDLHLPNGLVRSYSLCEPANSGRHYVIGVLDDRNSRGGSRYVHRQLRVGEMIDISAPRNNFELYEDAPCSVLVSGGIGITPILCMLQRLAELGRPAQLVYCARSRNEAAFVDTLEALAGKVDIAWHFDDEQGEPPDLGKLLAGRGAASHYYCCGPAAMLDAFERACTSLSYSNIHIERFTSSQPVLGAASTAFDVECVQSGKSVPVTAGKTILEVLLDAGLSPGYSCRQGVCGACETAVLDCDGTLDHRDDVLTDAERQSGKTMMICVSRCTGKKLVLDI